MNETSPLILYVDDDDDLRDSMRTVLESSGFRFCEAATGEEGLRQYQAHAPDLVILDMMMEEIDTGTSMVRDLQLAGCAVPIIVISSIGEELAQSTDTHALGLAAVLQKPVDFKSLLELIRLKLK